MNSNFHPPWKITLELQRMGGGLANIDMIFIENKIPDNYERIYCILNAISYDSTSALARLVSAVENRTSHGYRLAKRSARKTACLSLAARR